MVLWFPVSITMLEKKNKNEIRNAMIIFCGIAHFFFSSSLFVCGPHLNTSCSIIENFKHFITDNDHFIAFKINDCCHWHSCYWFSVDFLCPLTEFQSQNEYKTASASNVVWNVNETEQQPTMNHSFVNEYKLYQVLCFNHINHILTMEITHNRKWLMR